MRFYKLGPVARELGLALGTVKGFDRSREKLKLAWETRAIRRIASRTLRDTSTAHCEMLYGDQGSAEWGFPSPHFHYHL